MCRPSIVSPVAALFVGLLVSLSACRTRPWELDDASSDLAVPDLAVSDLAHPDLGFPDLSAPRIVDPLDILFVVANEPYTRAVREHVATGAAVLFPYLAAGSRDWHVGLVTADLGGGGVAYLSQGCTADGDGGKLLPRATADCAALKGRYLANEHGITNFTGDPGQLFARCLAASTAPEGCMYLQPWKAAFRALSGQVPENTGFLRRGGRLLIVFIIDMDDCSTPPGSDLLDPQAPYVGPRSRLSDRCVFYGNECNQNNPGQPGVHTGCHPIAKNNGLLLGATEFVAGVDNLKRIKDEVVIGYLAGASGTTYTVSDKGYVDTQCTEGDMGNTPLDLGIPGNSEVAIPSPRVIQIVQALGGFGSAEVCAPDYSPFFRLVGQRSFQ